MDPYDNQLTIHAPQDPLCQQHNGKRVLFCFRWLFLCRECRTARKETLIAMRMYGKIKAAPNRVVEHTPGPDHPLDLTKEGLP